MLQVRPARVAPRDLAGLAARLGVPAPARTAEVTGITHDSRDVRPGDVYAALPGAHVHGAGFAREATDAGAVAVLTDPEGAARCGEPRVPVLTVADPRAVLGGAASFVYGEPSRDLLLLGVTGTNGKTTTVFCLEAGLRAAGHRTGMAGTVVTRIGADSVPSIRTTPEATDLHALLATMRERGVSAVAMEVSSHALVMGRVDGVEFDVAAFTNLSEDHLDFHHDLDDYFAAKARLFTPELARRAVVCVDDVWGRRLAARATVPVATCSIESADADWQASDVDARPDGSRFRITGPDGAYADGGAALPGPFNVSNALLAVATLATAGVPVEAAAAGVAAMPGVPGRMERVDAGQPFLAVVDYAHTPDAVEALLRSLRTVTAGRLVVVLGCGGDRDRAKRPLMGAAAARLSDLAVLTSDNPRSESATAILDQMAAGVATVPVPERGEVRYDPDRRRAITAAVAAAAPSDVVVVAGKGHEQGQDIGGVVHPFDDRDVLRDALGHLSTRSIR
ncbi:MAG: UDP-N-acetylmuramoyl-L-alanyl-D-glutamate--2,6-diaminopimelate ligase [Streptosporangiales bacterium]